MSKLKFIKTITVLKKSRLAGFFVFGIMLLSCQPTEADLERQLMQQAQTSATAAKRLAKTRLAANELDAALSWWRQAALLGDSEALEHALRLQLRLQGKLEAARWLEVQYLVEKDAPLALPAITTLSAALLAELGFWQHLPALDVAGWQSPAGCAITLQPVASQQQGVNTWQRLLQQWQQDKQLQQLPVCYLPLRTIESTALACSEQGSQRISCQYQPLETLVAQGEFSQLVVVAGRGTASYNNGVLHVPEQANLALFRHEFMHILGFIDEYALSEVAAQDVCLAEHNLPNLVIGNNDEQLQRYLQHWQLDVAQIELTAVNTCDAIGISAYRVVAQVNLMHYYETGLPVLYYQLMQRILQQPEQLMPVQYYFAYLARQRQDWPAWQHYMQHAAGQGYSNAINALQ